MSPKERAIISKGEKVSLVVPEKEDIADWYIGINNPEINQFLNAHNRIYSLEKEEKFYEEIGTDENRFVFSIFVNKTKKVIGNIMLSVDHFYKTAGFGIAIYDISNLEKGYGTESLKLLLDYGFRVQGLRKVHGSVFGDNDRAFHVYKKVGFKEVGKYKEHRYKNGKYIDEILIEIFRDEFYEINKKYFEKLKNG